MPIKLYRGPGKPFAPKRSNLAMPIRLYGTNLTCARFLVSLVAPFLDRQNDLLDADLARADHPKAVERATAGSSRKSMRAFV